LKYALELVEPEILYKMYTGYIGKKFLDLYNRRTASGYDAETFFNKVFFDLFFNSEQHLMHVGNSPFFQKPKEEDVKKHGNKSLAQFQNLKEKMKVDVPNMSIYVGYAASDATGTTSGQVTDMEIEIDKNEMYASWVGQALAIGVSGGYVMLVDREDVLWNLFIGWSYYRKYLGQTPNVKDKQIETWNGNWLEHSLGDDFRKSEPDFGLNIQTESVQGKIAIPTIPWSRVVYKFSKQYPTEELMINAYSLSQTNMTFGFIKIILPEVQKLFEVRKKIYDLKINNRSVENKDLEKFETFYNFKGACQMGTIGLKALEPAKLRQYMPKGTILFSQGKDFKFNNEQSYYLYEIYQIWIMAMLNKTELLELASKIADHLIELENKDSRGKKVLTTLSTNLRESKHIKAFISNVSEILKELPDRAEVLKSAVMEVLAMPTDDFPLFVTLIRFEYNYQKTKN